MADKSVRAVVLHGEGRAFSAGLDFASFMGNPDLMQKLLARGEKSPANVAQRIAWIWQEVQVPVIAAVHGVAFGGGLQIALGADIRYVSPDAQLSVLEIKWGLIPDMSITQTLTRLVPLDVAKELTFTGRIISGAEAVELGLATKVSQDPLADALETAKLIATKSPHAIRAGKTLLNEALTMSRADALKLETALQVGLLGSPNQMEAVQANMMKRDPDFKDPE
jgi:enoyl-CoA hydratase/carnithine racemase